MWSITKTSLLIWRNTFPCLWMKSSEKYRCRGVRQVVIQSYQSVTALQHLFTLDCNAFSYRYFCYVYVYTLLHFVAEHTTLWISQRVTSRRLLRDDVSRRDTQGTLARAFPTLPMLPRVVHHPVSSLPISGRSSRSRLTRAGSKLWHQPYLILRLGVAF